MKSSQGHQTTCQFLILFLLGILCPLRAQIYEKVYGFAGDPNNPGINPKSGLVQGSDGSLYGTTVAGGASGFGTVFRMGPDGVVTTMAEFTGVSAAAATTRTFSYTSTITLNDSYSAAPYPARITVPSGIGSIAKVRVSLNNLNTASPQDTRFLLVGPTGSTCLLMSGTGNSTISGANLTLDDAAPNPIPSSIASGTYRPTPGGDAGINMNSPAPPAPYGTQLSVFGGQAAAGIWSLYALDDAGAGILGELKGGWDLEITPTGFRGSQPSGLVEGNEGNLYGTTSAGGNSGNGTIFMITPTGMFTTLEDFPVNNGTKSALVQGSDGSFYGVSSAGGTDGLGSLFRLAPGQPLETLASFTGINGSAPLAALVQGRDGKFYGTSSSGGTSGSGTVFRFTPGQALETLVNFTGNGASNKGATPLAPLAEGGDGKFYGTTSAGGTNGFGTVFRFTPGQPIETLVNFSGNGASNKGSLPGAALVQAGDGKFYGTTSAGGTNGLGTAFRLTPGQNTETLANFSAPDGNPHAPLTIATDGLPYGTTSGSDGAIYRLIQPTAPILYPRPPVFASSSAAVNDSNPINPKHNVLLQVDVNSAGASASVYLEYGSDSNNFPSPTLVAGTVSGIANATRQFLSSDIPSDRTYYFRFRATNSFGTTVGPIQSFTTCFPYSRTDFDGQSLRGSFPGVTPQGQGSVLVNILPPGIGGWRFEGEMSWREPGVPAAGLAAGERTIHYRPIPGYIQPISETVRVIDGTVPTIARIYYATGTPGTSNLNITLKPEVITLGSVPVAQRAQWRIIGEDAGKWRDSGTTRGDLSPGHYLVDSKPVAGRNTPPPIPVHVSGNGIATHTITYLPEDGTTGDAPNPVPFATVTTDRTKPYMFVGQIRSNVGYGSGFLVRPRTVATAAHVIFDDVTLSGITDLQWLFQQDKGIHEPQPMTPRGSYILTGYAARRTLENSPGDFAQESQNLDVGAIYFFEEDAGRGGFTGFLTSGRSPNEFLVPRPSNTNPPVTPDPSFAMITGYPVSGISPSDQGKMHTTAPKRVVFTKTFGQVLTTTDIHSGYGSDGGPVCVQRPDGNYYPVAIHLGSSGQTTLHGIDNDVKILFDWAHNTSTGNGNPPNSGPTQTGIDDRTLPSTNPGALKVIIEPAAVSDSAGWRMMPEITFLKSGGSKFGLMPGSYSLEFKPVAGMAAPAAQTVSVTSGALTSVTVTYSASLTPLEAWRQTNFGTTDNTGDAADGEDPDKDGVKNIDEFTAGTDPNNPSDFLYIATAAKSGSTFTATCAGKAGRTYTLQRSASLSGAWPALTSVGPLAADGPVSLTDTSAPAGTSFYRIEVSMP